MPQEEIKPVVSLADPVALRAYAHPLRLALVGLLRREGPLTATQAAARLSDNVPNCSFHLRQLAKYGLVERAEGADAREKPWRATALVTQWGHAAGDPEMRAAVDHLDSVVTARYFERARHWLAERDSLPEKWRRHTGPGDTLLFVTAEELQEVQQALEKVFEKYLPRVADPALRPKGSRAVNLIQIAITLDGEEKP
ncbi:MAG TPA: helix-turn-helix domain-containing protein [Candidatus Limnocylindrales bacterium]|nr:helix-turn-helix domain-containing protein [Candidatus Limnocylindrales bacterium]